MAPAPTSQRFRMAVDLSASALGAALRFAAAYSIFKIEQRAPRSAFRAVSPSPGTIMNDVA